MLWCIEKLKGVPSDVLQLLLIMHIYFDLPKDAFHDTTFLISELFIDTLHKHHQYKNYM